MHRVNIISDAQAIAATIAAYLESELQRGGTRRREKKYQTQDTAHGIHTMQERSSSLDPQDSLGVSEIGELSPDAVD